eukprot:15470463-Alexandrium_andersonii.AAC.1
MEPPALGWRGLPHLFRATTTSLADWAAVRAACPLAAAPSKGQGALYLGSAGQVRGTSRPPLGSSLWAATLWWNGFQA